MPSLGRVQVSKATASYSCDECNSEIAAGEIHLTISGRMKGNRWINNRVHLPCFLHLARRRYAQKDVAALPEDQRAARRKLLNARSYAIRTGNLERLKEVQEAISAFGVVAPYRGLTKIAAAALRNGATVPTTTEPLPANYVSPLQEPMPAPSPEPPEGWTCELCMVPIKSKGHASLHRRKLAAQRAFEDKMLEESTAIAESTRDASSPEEGSEE